jgi:hypothetical protein
VPLWETVKNWREEIVRIAQGKGQHRALIREIAADYCAKGYACVRLSRHDGWTRRLWPCCS